MHTGDARLLAADAPRLLAEPGGTVTDPTSALFGAMFVAEWLLTEVQRVTNRPRADIMTSLQQYVDEPGLVSQVC